MMERSERSASWVRHGAGIHSVTKLRDLIKAGGIGPFAGGYGFGVRSTLLGYFLRFDAGWEMNTFFQDKPVLNVSMGVDF